MSTPLPTRPRLRQDTVVLETPDGMFVRGAQDSFIVRGKSAYRYLSILMPHLDGTTTTQKITEGLPQAHADAVRSLLAQLASRGVLIDAPETGDVVGAALRDRFGPQTALLEHHGDDGRGFLRVAEARVVIAADNAETGAELARALEANGVGAQGSITVGSLNEDVDPVGADLVCVPALESPHPRLLEHADAAKAAGAAFLALLRVGEQLLISPLQTAEGGVDLRSLLLRMSDNAVPGAAELWQAIGSGVSAPQPPPLPGAATPVAVGITAFEIFKTLSGVIAPDVDSRAVVIDPRLLTARSEPVAAHPVVRSSPVPLSTLAGAEDSADVESAYTRFEAVVAETTGVMRGFDDDALPQIPVKAAVLRAPAVRPEPVVAFSSDTLLRARLAALEQAAAEYALGVHRRCDLLPAAAENTPEVSASQLETWTGTVAPKWNPVAARDLGDGAALAVDRSAVLAGPWDRDDARYEPDLTGLAAGPTAEEAAERALRDAATALTVSLAVQGQAAPRPVGAELLDTALDGAERARLAMLTAELDGPDAKPRFFLIPGPTPVALVRTAGRALVGAGRIWAEAAEAALRELVGRKQVGEVARPAPLLDASHDLVDVPDGAPLNDPADLKHVGDVEHVLAALGEDSRRAALIELTPPDLVGVTHVARVLLYRDGPPDRRAQSGGLTP